MMQSNWLPAYKTDATQVLCCLSVILTDVMQATRKHSAHLLLLELIDKVGQESIVKVLATKEGVTIGGLDLKNASAHLQDGDIEGSAAKIKDSKGTLHTKG